jgi:ribosome-binding ATPase YchF (GTP1/OBG family)
VERVVRSLDLDLVPAEWDADARAAVARETRKRTKPMVIAANKMDTPEAREDYAAIVDDPAYDHLAIVPTSVPSTTDPAMPTSTSWVTSPTSSAPDWSRSASS